MDNAPDETLIDYRNIPPQRLPLTTFIRPIHSFLAKRQSCLTMLMVSTEEAQKIAWKNQLHLVDLFQGLLQDLSSVTTSHPLAPFRTIGRSITMQWKDLQFQLVDSMIPMTPADAQNSLHQHAQLLPTDGDLTKEWDLLENQVDALLFDPVLDEAESDMQRSTHRQSQLDQITKDAFALTSPPNMPWLCRFRTALDDSTNWLEHDLIGAPSLCLVIVSTQEDNIVEAAKALCYSPHYLPEAYTTGVLDPASLRREVLVLHDAVDGPPDFREDDVITELKRLFGSGVTVLRINSLLPTTAKQLEDEHTTDLWGGGGTRGNCLSQSDRLCIRRYLAGIITSSLMPALERRIFELNNIVTERKKGVRNVFKSLWRAPANTPSSTTTASAKTSKYRHDSVESQVRLLADTLFLIKDYDAALNMYKLIKDDYKQDRSLLHHGGIQEMMALCTYLLNDRSKEMYTYYETALFSYTRAAEEERKEAAVARPTTALAATRLATRLCLVMSATKNMTTERHLEVADLLASASSNETSLSAAVLLEQSAAHYFKAGMHRKFAFHTLMAGHMFRSGSQEHHAFRCFTSALYIYHEGQWVELHNHLRSALAAHLYALGRMAACVELYAKLVGTTGGGRVSVKSQQKFVQHLLEICKEHSEKALLGADRMAAPDQSVERQQRLLRIERVVQCTDLARRVLELPNMDLPHIEDASVTMEVKVEAAQRVGEVIPFLGTIGVGTDSVWQDLQCQAVAELRAADSKAEEEGSSALAKIDDIDIRRVIAEMDKEKTNQNLLARAKRSGSYKENPTVRARKEPLTVSFDASNPLAVLIELKDVQLVAQLRDSQQRVCTNADAIDIARTCEESKSWTFESSTHSFFTPAFCRTSPVAGEEVEGPWTSVNDEDPFFVVTKMDVALQPGSNTRLELSICPLVKGDLEVLGVRCKLFNDVWVYHPFKMKGPLLQNSAENKAGRVRAESMKLKAKVEEDMPRLTINLISSNWSPSDMMSSPALEGQVSKWTLQISNQGSAPSRNLTLKTNLPWINIAIKKKSEEEATSCCVGPSGTLITLSTDEILPGTTIDIPVFVRTAGTASQDFYMLYRYEHAHDSKKQRWLQQMIAVPIHQSLQVKATLMPSFWARDEHLVSVEVTNLKSGTMVLNTVGIASREYRLTPIAGQTDVGADVRLDTQERVSIHYRLLSDDKTTTCVFSECPFAGTTSSTFKDCINIDTVDYLCLEGAHARFRAGVKAYEAERASAGDDDDQQPRHVSQIRRSKAAQLDGKEDGPCHPSSLSRLFPLCDRKAKINLICTWKSWSDDGANVVCGQHHIADLLVRPKSKSKGCPITITCQHLTSVPHDFTKGPVYISLDVTVRNRLIDAAVEFEFSLEPQKTFEIMGGECFSWNMEGGEELTVPLQAVIPSPGIYNLQSVRLTVIKEGKRVPYLFPLQWMVNVSSSEGTAIAI